MVDSLDNIKAVQKFLRHTNVMEGDSIAALHASVIYTKLKKGNILYRPEEPIEVQIDTENYNTITISNLPRGYISTFNVEDMELDYVYEVLYINDGDTVKPYVVH